MSHLELQFYRDRHVLTAAPAHHASPLPIPLLTMHLAQEPVLDPSISPHKKHS